MVCIYCACVCDMEYIGVCTTADSLSGEKVLERLNKV